MIKNRYFRRFFILFLLGVPFLSQGQGKRQREYSGFFDSYYYRGPVSYTASFGLTAANGDLGPFYKSPVIMPAFAIGANYRLWPRTVFGAELSYFQLAATDNTPLRQISFTSANFELDLYGRLYIIDDITRIAVDRRKKPKMFKPYLMSGIGLLNYNAVSVYSSDSLTDSTFLQGAKVGMGSSGFTPVVPVGLGLSIFITHRISVLTEVAYRFAFSDLLDAVAFSGGAGKDGYASVSLKVQYSPTAPKRKKRKSIGTAPDQYNGPKGTETWKNKKPEKKKSRYQEEYVEPVPETPPGETPQETPPGETPPGETPQETPQENNGGEKIENQIEEPVK